jgi:predicted GNAT family N-acyltransferase
LEWTWSGQAYVKIVELLQDRGVELIKEVGKKDLKQAIELVNNVFSEFVAVDYSEQGKRTFNDYLENKYEEVSSDLVSGYKKMWAYYQNEEIVGVIAVRDTTHITLMFVDKQHHKKGIAKEMFSFVLDEITRNKEITQVTVNSSPYAVKVYERLGFVKTDEQQEKDGIIFIPMARDTKSVYAVSG